MTSIGETRRNSKKAKSAEIELLTRDFLVNGGEIQREDIRATRQVDLTWRNYAATAMEDSGNGEEV